MCCNTKFPSPPPPVDTSTNNTPASASKARTRVRPPACRLSHTKSSSDRLPVTHRKPTAAGSSASSGSSQDMQLIFQFRRSPKVDAAATWVSTNGNTGANDDDDRGSRGEGGTCVNTGAMMVIGEAEARAGRASTQGQMMMMIGEAEARAGRASTQGQ